MTKPSPFTLLALRHTTRHPIQSLLLILGVALGVAMIVAIDLANGSASQAFALSTDSIAGKATHQIVAAPGDLPTSLYEQLRVELGLTDVAPVVTGLVLLKNADDLPLQLLGIDPFAEPPFRTYLGDGSGQLSFNALLSLLIEPNTVLLPQALAEQYNLAPGDTLTLLAGGQTKAVQLVGLLQPGDELSRRALNGLILADISTAQEVLNLVGRLSHIDLILPPETDPQPILDRLPVNARLQQAALRNQTLNQMTAAFELNLSALSLLALIVGMFLIYNTISFSVVQRRPVLGTLRCLGVTRREIFSLVLGEALVLSALGAVIGLGLGVILGRGLVGLVTQTINDLYFTLTVQSVSLSPLTLYKGLVAGLAAGLLAAFVPALEATTVPPNSALKRSLGEARMQRLIPGLAAASIVMMLAGWGLLNLGSRSLPLSFTALFIILLGSAFLSPLLTKLLMALLQRVTPRLFGIIGLMAPRDIIRSLSRTSVTIAALMLAVTVIIGVSVMIDSFRNTVVTWLDSILAADIYISPAGQNLRVEGDINPDFIEQARQIEGVEAVSLLRSVVVFSENYEEVELRGLSPEPRENRRPMLWAVGSAAELEAARQAGGVLVSEVFARSQDLPLDRPSVITLITERGPQPFEVVGIFYDYAVPDKGYVLMRLQTYRTYWPGDTAISNIALFLSPAAASQADALAQKITDEFAAKYFLSVSSNRGIKENALEVFDRTFTITAALRLLATVVAFIGVLSAIMSLQLERTRELGTLRANGMSVLQLWGKTLLETALMGLTAGLMAMPIGWALAYILVHFINLRSFGWSLQMRTSPDIFGMALLVALLAALLAGIYPVVRLKNMQIAVAVREE
ncbi:MAG: ABC transporter permease [Anaerolineae bacterium]|nr:FtsX-like permease family protein [Anaerolineales bacterium]MCQ3973650.1 ABC transporter permease [Anaerolineae bacterium]